MPTVADACVSVSPLLAAALLLTAVPHLQRLALPCPSAAEVFAATGAGRSQAYVLSHRVEEALATCQQRPGRPAAPSTPPTAAPDLRDRVIDFVYAHPGCVHDREARRWYSDDFRLFALDLCAEHHDVAVPALASQLRLPEETLRDWLRGERPQVEPPATAVNARSPTQPQVETVLDVWDRWHGGFLAFCKHVQVDWRIPFGRSMLSEILEVHGVRTPKRRGGRSPDESALRALFTTFFPGAQWVGDGRSATVSVDGTSFTFNVELNVDADTGAFVGATVTHTEDAAAVVAAFHDAVVTTGSPPLALLLDNKPSNHAPEVADALGATVLIRATPFRPQNKAHVEGGHGLFAQTAPAISLSTADPAELAREVLAMQVVTWARAANHRPRRDRGGASRARLYASAPPTPEEVERARQQLEARRRQQELARQTLAARQDPMVRAALAQAFARFSLSDPDGHFATAIARYPYDHVLAGIATFAGKRTAGTLPANADARYLLGIVRNIASQDEGWDIADELWRARLAAHDAALSRLDDQRESLEVDLDEDQRVARYIDLALAARRRLDRLFWLAATVDVIPADSEARLREPLFRLAARRIHATHAVDHRERQAAVRFIAQRVLPLT
jgi:hypothetical protein